MNVLRKQTKIKQIFTTTDYCATTITLLKSLQQQPKIKSEEIKAIKINSGADVISNHDDIIRVNNEPDTRFKRLNSKSSKPSHKNLPNEDFKENSESAKDIKSKYEAQRENHEIKLQEIGTYTTGGNTLITIKKRKAINDSKAAPEDDLESLYDLHSEKDVGLFSGFEK